MIGLLQQGVDILMDFRHFVPRLIFDNFLVALCTSFFLGGGGLFCINYIKFLVQM